MAGGAPLGNTNNTKNRKWSSAIDKALKQYNEGDVEAGHALDKIAMRLVKKAVTTEDPQEFDKAIAVIGDRIDGKPSQAVEVSGAGGGPVQWEFLGIAPSGERKEKE